MSENDVKRKVALDNFVRKQTGWSVELASKKLDRAILLLVEAKEARQHIERLEYPEKPKGAIRTFEEAAAYGKKVAEYHAEIKRLIDIYKMCESEASAIALQIHSALPYSARITRRLNGIEYEVEIDHNVGEGAFIELKASKSLRFDLDDREDK